MGFPSPNEHTERAQDIMIPVYLDEQMVDGTFEHMLNELIEFIKNKIINISANPMKLLKYGLYLLSFLPQ